MRKKHALIFAVLFVAGFMFFAKTVQENRHAAQTAAGALRESVIILDAGHGGFDGGTVAADGTLEKEINLSIVRKIDALFHVAGVQTILTRTDDNSIHDEGITSIRKQKISDIHNRLHIMEETENALFVSIHQNHYEEAQYRGTQVFYSGNHPQSKVLAQSIQNSVIQSLQPENMRTIKRSGTEIYLLYHAVRPAVMVECGFLSNAEETALLKQEKYQEKMAMAIYKGILQYRENTEVV